MNYSVEKDPVFRIYTLTLYSLVVLTGQLLWEGCGGDSTFVYRYLVMYVKVRSRVDFDCRFITVFRVCSRTVALALPYTVGLIP